MIALARSEEDIKALRSAETREDSDYQGSSRDPAFYDIIKEIPATDFRVLAFGPTCALISLIGFITNGGFFSRSSKQTAFANPIGQSFFIDLKKKSVIIWEHLQGMDARLRISFPTNTIISPAERFHSPPPSLPHLLLQPKHFSQWQPS